MKSCIENSCFRGLSRSFKVTFADRAQDFGR
jgi:hypothetical protein